MNYITNYLEKNRSLKKHFKQYYCSMSCCLHLVYVYFIRVLKFPVIRRSRLKVESNHFKILEVQLLCLTDSPPLIFVLYSCAFASIVLHMHKKFEVNQIKIRGLSPVSRIQKLHIKILIVICLSVEAYLGLLK